MTVAISGDEVNGCDAPGTNAQEAPRIRELLQLSQPNSYWTDICGSDYNAPLQEALEVIERSCNDFPPVG